MKKLFLCALVLAVLLAACGKTPLPGDLPAPNLPNPADYGAGSQSTKSDANPASNAAQNSRPAAAAVSTFIGSIRRDVPGYGLEQRPIYDHGITADPNIGNLDSYPEIPNYCYMDVREGDFTQLSMTV